VRCLEVLAGDLKYYRTLRYFINCLLFLFDFLHSLHVALLYFASICVWDQPDSMLYECDSRDQLHITRRVVNRPTPADLSVHERAVHNRETYSINYWILRRSWRFLCIAMFYVWCVIRCVTIVIALSLIFDIVCIAIIVVVTSIVSYSEHFIASNVMQT